MRDDKQISQTFRKIQQSHFVYIVVSHFFQHFQSAFLEIVERFLWERQIDNWNVNSS